MIYVIIITRKGDENMANISNTTNLNVRVDNTLKQESDMLFKDLGLNMSTAINMFLTKCVKTRSIPFEISEPKLSKKLQKALKEADKIANDPTRKKYHDIDELMEALLDD